MNSRRVRRKMGPFAPRTFQVYCRRFRSNPVGHRADKSREQSPLVGSPSRGTVIPHEIQPGTSILTLRLVARDLLQFRDTAVVAQSSYYLQAVQAPLDGLA